MNPTAEKQSLLDFGPGHSFRGSEKPEQDKINQYFCNLEKRHVRNTKKLARSPVFMVYVK